MNRKFELGRTVVTRGIDKRMNESRDFEEFVVRSLGKYVQGDWGENRTFAQFAQKRGKDAAQQRRTGDTCDEDKQVNEDSLRDGERLLAVYIYPETGEKIWIITEWDRSVTTILFPEEY